jgi:hypothetical protein
VIRVEIRRLHDQQVLLQVDDHWHLVTSLESAAQLGAMLLDAAWPDSPPASYTTDLTEETTP